MRPYTHILHIITNGYDQPHVKIELSDLAQSDIIMWRSIVLLLIANPKQLSQSMNSFRPQPPDYIVTSQHILYYCTYYSLSLTCTVHCTIDIHTLYVPYMFPVSLFPMLEFVAVVLGFSNFRNFH